MNQAVGEYLKPGRESDQPDVFIANGINLIHYDDGVIMDRNKILYKNV